MTTAAQRAANARYDRANTKQVSVKLNIKTDADILAHLDMQASVQGYIKRLVREDMLAMAEDARMEERLAGLMARGEAKVSYSVIDGLSEAFFDVSDPDVERWLVRRLDATQTALTEGTWVVDAGNGGTTDRIVMPMIDRLLADPLADAPRFSTIGDAIAYVETALGEYVGDYDVESIAREVTDWVDGQLMLVRDGDEFWEVCARYDTTA